MLNLSVPLSPPSRPTELPKMSSTEIITWQCQEGFEQAFSVHLQKVPQEGQRTGARREAAMGLWAASGQEDQESGEQSKEKEHAELHGRSLKIGRASCRERV